jgi:rhodanese-related sulfurtransferase
MLARGIFAVAIVWTCLIGSAVEAQLFRSGPEVKDISAKELHRLMLEKTQQITEAKQKGAEARPNDFVVVDVREPKEYQVSMIPGAVTKAEYEKNSQSYAGVTVIPYCTVGGRSASYAKQLASKGVKVLNFKESIIGWCNAQLPLVTIDGKSTNQVHTYNSRNKVPAMYKAVF